MASVLKQIYKQLPAHTSNLLHIKIVVEIFFFIYKEILLWYLFPLSSKDFFIVTKYGYNLCASPNSKTSVNYLIKGNKI